jgi:hypothetical protein
LPKVAQNCPNLPKIFLGDSLGVGRGCLTFEAKAIAFLIP